GPGALRLPPFSEQPAGVARRVRPGTDVDDGPGRGRAGRRAPAGRAAAGPGTGGPPPPRPLPAGPRGSGPPAPPHLLRHPAAGRTGRRGTRGGPAAGHLVHRRPGLAVRLRRPPRPPAVPRLAGGVVRAAGPGRRLNRRGPVGPPPPPCPPETAAPNSS